MALYLAAIALGNLVTALVNRFIQNEDGTVKLQGAAYYSFFLYVMLATSVVWLIVSPFYRGKSYIQNEGKTEPQGA
jgi:POT family proton-dependent oligopeptide transporter